MASLMSRRNKRKETKPISLRQTRTSPPALPYHAEGRPADQGYSEGVRSPMVMMVIGDDTGVLTYLASL